MEWSIYCSTYDEVSSFSLKIYIFARWVGSLKLRITMKNKEIKFLFCIHFRKLLTCYREWKIAKLSNPLDEVCMIFLSIEKLDRMFHIYVCVVLDIYLLFIKFNKILYMCSKLPLYAKSSLNRHVISEILNVC